MTANIQSGGETWQLRSASRSSSLQLHTFCQMLIQVIAGDTLNLETVQGFEDAGAGDKKRMVDGIDKINFIVYYC